MKKIANSICVVLLIIGMAVAYAYATQEVKSPFKEGYHNGQVYVDENGNASVVHYWDLGSTERKQEENKIVAGAGYIFYAFAIVGTRYFVELKIKTKKELKRTEKELEEDLI